MRNGMKWSTTVVVLSAVFLAGPVRSEQYAFAGARANGMGGANAVSTRDATAQWHNPAAFGFMHSETNRLDRNKMGEQDFGWSIVDAGAGYAMTGDMGKYLDMILNEIDFDSFDVDGLGTSPDAVKSMLAMGSALYGLDEKGTAVYVDANAGTGFRFGHFGIGLRVFGESVAYLDEMDVSQLGIGQTAAEFATSINSIAAADGGFDAGTYGGFQTLTPAQQASLLGQVNNDSDALKYIDHQLTQLKADGTLDQADIDHAVTFANDITFGSGSFSDNESTMIGRAFGVVEIPLSYGHSFGDHLSVGVTAKGMYGTVTGTKLWFFNEDSIDDSIETISENTEATLAFGLDVGILYRLPMLQFAVVGHNLNSPEFNGFTDTIDIETSPGVFETKDIHIPDVTLDPQVTLGAAFIPSRRFMLEVNYDMMKTGTLLDGYENQRLSLGGELDLWLLALRLGAYNNLALDDPDWVATAGVGLNLFGLRVDVGGAYSLGDKVEYDGNEIPNEARLYASFSLDF